MAERDLSGFNTAFGYGDIFKIVGFIVVIALAWGDMTTKIAVHETRIDAVEEKIEDISEQESEAFAAINSRLIRLERKLDEFIMREAD